ncbi:hypothetical protein GCM10010359_50350 [Streptomyces morookaense]|nr:hypothetical protein GCM10010359_50350 [Streptomyces morookaense]
MRNNERAHDAVTAVSTPTVHTDRGERRWTGGDGGVAGPPGEGTVGPYPLRFGPAVPLTITPAIAGRGKDLRRWHGNREIPDSLRKRLAVLDAEGGRRAVH